MPARRDPIAVRFGARVRALRNERKISQEALAEAAGIHRTYVGGIEQGVRNPSLKNIYRIAQALDVHLVKLFENL